MSELKRINSEKFLIGETKSEINYPNSPSNRNDELKVKESTKTQIHRTFGRSPTNKFAGIKYLTTGFQGSHDAKNMYAFPVEEVASQRPTLAETEIIR
jgi:hypothetical protein